MSRAGARRPLRHRLRVQHDGLRPAGHRYHSERRRPEYRELLAAVALIPVVLGIAITLLMAGYAVSTDLSLSPNDPKAPQGAPLGHLVINWLPSGIWWEVRAPFVIDRFFLSLGLLIYGKASLATLRTAVSLTLSVVGLLLFVFGSSIPGQVEILGVPIPFSIIAAFLSFGLSIAGLFFAFTSSIIEKSTAVYHVGAAVALSSFILAATSLIRGIAR